MGRQIIKQPNDKYAVWSSTVDDFIFIDVTQEELIKLSVADIAIDIKEQIEMEIAMLEKGEKPNYQFTLTFNEAVEMIKETHGKDAESILWLQKHKII